MSPLYREYRAQAEYSMKMAEKAPSEEMRADWLKLAAKWLAMVPHRERSEHERFETNAQRNGTGHSNSSMSH